MSNLILDMDVIKKSPIKDLLQRLSSSEKGLSASEADARLRQYGYNEIKEIKENPLLKFLSYFWGPIPWMIEAAAVLSAIIRHWDDFVVIAVLLVINAAVAFWQEHKADNAIEQLKEKLALQAKALRDGKWMEIPARELVPGDVVRIRLGEILPADIKLINGDYLQVDESALTGESLPVEKLVSDIGYSGSIARKGEMDGLVVATGMNTFFGKTARLVEEAETVSHFQKAIVKIGDYLIVLAVALVAVIFMFALFRHESIINTLQFALVLTVAAIPAALPAVLSITMAVGAVALSRREAIVSKLAAIEEMAGMDILCSDKTGTITKNELTLADMTPFGDFSDDDLLMLSSLCSREEDNDPIDAAIISKWKESRSARAEYKVKEFTPFDPVSKRAEALVEDEKGVDFKVAKGAPQVILSLASDREGLRKQLDKCVNDFAGKGFRALGVARTDGDGKWQYAGVLALYDPPRDDSRETITTAGHMGVEVKMITGDHDAVAKEIARQVNLGSNIRPASDLSGISDVAALNVIKEANGFAQVFPEHKYHIVELLQREGHILGMTGDGVNDAPALKKADAGVAVTGATDAAKSAADIVLTRPGLSVIVDAIKESRKIFQRMNSYAIYRIAETLRVLFFITLCILIFKFYPVTAIMIVLLALFNDAPIMTIAYDNVHYSDEPEKWNMRSVISISTILGLVGVFFTFGLFYVADRILHLDGNVIQSFIFLKLAVAGHLTIFMSRCRGPFWSMRPSAPLFWSTVATKALATLFVVYGWYVAPIGWKLAGVVWGWALLELVITDPIKILAYQILDHEDIKFRR